MVRKLNHALEEESEVSLGTETVKCSMSEILARAIDATLYIESIKSADLKDIATRIRNTILGCMESKGDIVALVNRYKAQIILIFGREDGEKVFAGLEAVTQFYLQREGSRKFAKLVKEDNPDQSRSSIYG